MFTLVLNTITASWHSAVSSASIGCEVGVGWSSIAFFVSFNDTISAFGGDLEEVHGSAISGLEASVVVRENASELGQLATRNWNWVGEDKPVSVFRAIAGGHGSSVVEGSWGSWQEGARVDGHVE